MSQWLLLLCLLNVLTEHAGGRRALYAGLTPTLIRAFPANAAQWLAWELSKRCSPSQYAYAAYLHESLELCSVVSCADAGSCSPS